MEHLYEATGRFLPKNMVCSEAKFGITVILMKLSRKLQYNLEK